MLTYEFKQYPTNAISRAGRIRGSFMRFALLTSVLTFIVVGGEALLDQLVVGSASPIFMLSTELIIAGACIGLFAVISAIGLAVSTAFSDKQPPQQMRGSSGSTGPINHRGNPRPGTGVKPNTTRRPALLSKGERHFRRLGS